VIKGVTAAGRKFLNVFSYEPDHGQIHHGDLTAC
jgi:hypothetical protein